MVPALAPQIEDEVAEAVDHRRRGGELGRGVDEAENLEPAGDAIQVPELGRRIPSGPANGAGNASPRSPRRRSISPIGSLLPQGVLDEQQHARAGRGQRLGEPRRGGHQTAERGDLTGV